MGVLHQPSDLLLDSFKKHFPLFFPAPHHTTHNPPQHFRLRKACQRKSSQAEDIVERLWQAESNSNGSIMSLIMVWVSIIYQGRGLSEAGRVELNDDCSAGWQVMMSLHSQWYDKARAEGGQAPIPPVSLRAGPWGLSHGQACSSRSTGLENHTWLVASTGSWLTLWRPCIFWNRELGDLTLPRENMLTVSPPSQCAQYVCVCVCAVMWGDAVTGYSHKLITHAPQGDSFPQDRIIKCPLAGTSRMM